MTVNDYYLSVSGSLMIDTTAGEVTVHPADLCAAIVAAGFADEYNEEYELLFKDDNYYQPQSLQDWYNDHGATTDFLIVIKSILDYDRKQI